jgi:hypothetical protein
MSTTPQNTENTKNSQKWPKNGHFLATFSAFLRMFSYYTSFMVKKWPKIGQKWPKMGQKVVKNTSKHQNKVQNEYYTLAHIMAKTTKNRHFWDMQIGLGSLDGR